MTDTDRLDALAEAATPGNWSYFIDDYGEGDRPGTMVITADPKGGQGYLAADLSQPDAAFIVAVVNAYPQLAAAVRERDELREALQAYEKYGLANTSGERHALRRVAWSKVRAALHHEDGT